MPFASEEPRVSIRPPAVAMPLQPEPRRSPVTRLLDQENAIASIMNKAQHARLNAAGGWGDCSPMPAIASALAEIARDPERFHRATRYSETAGLATLRAAIAGALDGEVFGRRGVSADAIVVAGGGSTQLGFQALLLFGGPVLLPDPTYANYLDQAELAGLEVQRLPVVGKGGEFLPRVAPGLVLQAFEKICRTNPPTSVVIVSPDNPTGYIWPDDVLDRLVRIAESHQVMVILDRAYGSFYFGERPDHLSWSPASYPNLVALESFSKSFSLLGLRVGYAIAAPKVAAQLEALTQRITLCPGTLEQLALADFFSRCSSADIRAYLEAARCAYRDSFRRAKALVAELSPGSRVLEADGGFYLTVRVPESDGDDARFCDSLFEAERMLVVPGSAFGRTLRGWVRTAFAPHVRDPERLERVYRTLATRLAGA